MSSHTAIHSRFKSKLKEGKHIQFTQFSESHFEVLNPLTSKTRIIKLDEKSCSCGEWKEMGFPCRHGAYIIKELKRDVSAFVDPVYTLEYLKEVYKSRIVPVERELLLNDQTTEPPKVIKKAGRPKKRRIRSRGEVNPASQLTCSRCLERGHNIRTCAGPKRGDGRVEYDNISQESELERDSEMSNPNHEARNENLAPNTREIISLSPPPPIRPRKRREIPVCGTCGFKHYRKTSCRQDVVNTDQSQQKRK